MSWKNKLLFGDNLPMMREHVADESVDLVYLDPPFNSNATYNVLFKEHTGQLSHAQIAAFEDTWKWGIEAEAAYLEVTTQGSQKLSELMQAFRSFLRTSDMMAYVAMMAPRIAELHRVLKPTGSLYLHCDPTASHYIKLLLDAVFGPTHFRNEIVWKRTSAHSASKRWNDIHDTILFYTKSDEYTWNTVLLAHSEEYTARFDKGGDGEDPWTDDNLTAPGVRGGDSGSEWRGYNPTARGLHWKVSRAAVQGIVGVDKAAKMSTTEKLDLLDDHDFILWPKKKVEDGGGFPRFKRHLSKGAAIQDVISDIPPINSQAAERLGYPTQRPEALLDRILTASSNPGDLVLDPFCGCGTTIAVAEQLKRRWVGIDITHLAISLMRFRLRKTMGTQLSPYDVFGEPKDIEGASALAEVDRYQFQYWAAGLVDAQAVQGKKKDKKKGADAGIDGFVRFIDDAEGTIKTVIVQVKSGHVGVKDIRELIGVIKAEKAAIGVFITLEQPTKPMYDTALTEGFYHSTFTNKNYRRIQILTIQELLDGKRPEYPMVSPVTFKAATMKGQKAEQPKMI